MAWIALAGLAAGAASGAANAQAQRSSSKGRNKHLLDLLQTMYGENEAGFASQEQSLKQANKASEQGYQSAIDDADRAEAQGVASAQRYTDQALGGARASLSSRGFLGSSMETSARFGAARQGALMSSDAMIAASRLRTSARIGLGQQQSANLKALGALRAYRSQTRNALTGNYWNYVAGQQVQAQQDNYAGLGMLAAMYGTGGFGGGGGSPAPSAATHTYGTPTYGSSEYHHYGQSVA